MKRALVGIAAVFLVMSGQVNAAPILFDFNAAPVEMNSATGPDAIETYMEGIYGSDITLAAGARNEDDRMEAGGNTTYPYLGSTNGAIDRLGTCGTGPCAATNPDRFLINRWSSGFDRITITFVVVPITGIEFDWEIFPVTLSGNADLTFRWIDINGVSTDQLIRVLNNGDKLLGDMGHSSFTFSTPVRTIEFIDWTDAPIGVDNLRITQTPVPGTLLLLGAGVAALAVRRAARRRSKKPEGSSPTSN